MQMAVEGQQEIQPTTCLCLSARTGAGRELDRGAPTWVEEVRPAPHPAVPRVCVLING